MAFNDRELGMRQAISRRDFLNGVAIATGSLISPAALGRAFADSPEAMPDYYGLLLGSGPPEEAPRDAKRRLARELVTWLYSAADAERAEAAFDRLFVERELPEEIEEAGDPKEEEGHYQVDECDSEWGSEFAVVSKIDNGEREGDDEGSEGGRPACVPRGRA